jgi:hypothetical protein
MEGSRYPNLSKDAQLDATVGNMAAAMNPSMLTRVLQRDKFSRNLQKIQVRVTYHNACTYAPTCVRPTQLYSHMACVRRCSVCTYLQ